MLSDNSKESKPQAMAAQYQAYSLATRTVPKTRQVVMLYDGAIRFLKQAEVAIAEKRIEDRFKLLLRASEVINGLQSSIDFDNGGQVAHVLHRFYTDISVRILSINFNTEDKDLCSDIISELKQMRDVWEQIDRTLSSQDNAAPAAPSSSTGANSAGNENSNIALSV